MDGRETDQDRENCAPRPSLSNVLVQNAKLLFTAASIAPLVPLLLLPMGMHISVLHVYTHLPPDCTPLAEILQAYATTRRPPGLTLRVVWFTAGRVRFIF